jgi:hypothetical protein
MTTNKPLIESVASISISEGVAPAGHLESIEEVKEIAREELEIAVNAGSLVSFVAGLSAEEKDDVLYSTQFAQRAASAKEDRYQSVRPWYQAYVDILEQLGWVTEQFAFTHYEEDSGEVHMDAAAIKILAQLATAGQLTVLEGALEALRGLSEGSDEMTLLELNSTNEFGGNFQIGAAQKAENGAVSLVVGAFYFKTVNQQKRFLFFRWGKKSINFWTAAQKMTLNGEYFEQIRNAVTDKLGEGCEQLIRGIPLA